VVQAVFNYVKVGCKCHGVSGSCNLRTCWNQLPSFREAGDRLRDRYDGATEVTFNTQGTRLVQRNRKFNRPTREDLVYVEQSRDFCDADPSAGSPGTRGRTCDRHSNGMDGCDLMCCGRGYRTTKTKISERCRCRFQWCCRVECDTCERNVELNTCK
jgi:wingless-type MMTV integration site family, member 5